MGKRARSAYRAADKASSRQAASTAESRQQRDKSIDATMDAVTAQSKYSKPRVTRVQAGGRAVKRARGGPAAAETEEAAEDEIDQFHRQRDFIPLDSRHDDDERDEDEEELANARVLDLPDHDEEDEDEDQDDQGDEEDDGTDDDDDAFAPLPLDDLLDEDDIERRARSLAAEERLTTGWGRSKRLYYSADTVDFELESDEEAAVAEEREAERMMKETLQQRRPQDYTLAELLALRATKAPPSTTSRPPPSSASTSIRSLLDDDLAAVDGHVEEVDRADDLSEEERLQLLQQRAPEVLGLLEDMRTKAEEVEQVRRGLAGRTKTSGGRRPGGAWMKSAEVALSMYCSCALLFLAMKAEGAALHAHPINQQLVSAQCAPTGSSASSLPTLSLTRLPCAPVCVS